jgi:hypothetical protein
VTLTQEMARFYWSRGYQPIPSEFRVGHDRRPFVKWAHLVEKRVEFDWSRFKEANIQILTGRAFGLIVVDIDGDPAADQWRRWMPSDPRTWIVQSRAGRHYYFSVPVQGPPIPKVVPWSIPSPDRDGVNVSAIELFGDRSVITAPPSIHLKTGQRYKFLRGYSPREVTRPANAPPWLLGLAQARRKPKVVESYDVARRTPQIVTRPAPGLWWRFDDVNHAITDKVSLAQSWGLRVVGEPNRSDWIRCRSLYREDRNPSAGFHVVSGVYSEPGLPSVPVLKFFDLAVELGVYSSPEDARDDLAIRYNVPPRKSEGIPWLPTMSSMSV